MWNESYEKCVSNFKKEDKSIWKSIKNKRKPKTISKYATPPGPWAKSDKEKVEIFAEHLREVFSLHYNDQDQEDKQDPAMPIQSQ